MLRPWGHARFRRPRDGDGYRRESAVGLLPQSCAWLGAQLKVARLSIKSTSSAPHSMSAAGLGHGPVVSLVNPPLSTVRDSVRPATANSEPVDVLATSRTMGLHPVADRFNATGTLLGDIFDAVDRALAAARFVLGPTARALAPGPRRSPRWHSPPSPRRTLPDARGPLRRVRSQLHDTHEDDHDAHAWSPTVVPVSPPNLSRATHPPAACR